MILKETSLLPVKFLLLALGANVNVPVPTSLLASFESG